MWLTYVLGIMVSASTNNGKNENCGYLLVEPPQQGPKLIILEPSDDRSTGVFPPLLAFVSFDLLSLSLD